MDAQLTKIWHKGSGVISRTHGINCHSAEIKVDALVVDPQLKYNESNHEIYGKYLLFGIELVLADRMQ